MVVRDLRDKVNADSPLALGVITATGYGIVRKDGLLQVPVGTLRAWPPPPLTGDPPTGA